MQEKNYSTMYENAIAVFTMSEMLINYMECSIADMQKVDDKKYKYAIKKMHDAIKSLKKVTEPTNKTIKKNGEYMQFLDEAIVPWHEILDNVFSLKPDEMIRIKNLLTKIKRERK